MSEHPDGHIDFLDYPQEHFHAEVCVFPSPLKIQTKEKDVVAELWMYLVFPLLSS